MKILNPAWHVDGHLRLAEELQKHAADSKADKEVNEELHDFGHDGWLSAPVNLNGKT